jgi:hypothetical protein
MDLCLRYGEVILGIELKVWRSLNDYIDSLSPIERIFKPSSTSIQGVSINHCGLHVFVGYVARVLGSDCIN